MDQNNGLKIKYFKKLTRSQIMRVLIVLCCLFSCAAVYLFITMQQEGYLAEQKARNLLEAAQSTKAPNTTTLNPVLSGSTQYPVMAKLTIPKLKLELPVINEYSDEALKVSVCRYIGPTQPGQAGNLVIIGHDYKSGAHFGRVGELKSGDTIILMDTWGKEYTYEVYELKQVTPDDVQSLNIYQGTSAVTLLTCTNNANKRLLVRCKMVNNP